MSEEYISFRYEKLVRDRALEDLNRDSIVVHHDVVADEHFVQKLKERMNDDVQAILCEEDRDKIIEKLADLKQVALSLIHELKIHEAEIEKVRIQKKIVRGSFDKKKYIKQVDVERGTREERHFTQNPHHYPPFDQTHQAAG